MGEGSEIVALALALAVRALRSGSVCVDLRTVASDLDDPDQPQLPWPDPEHWLAEPEDPALGVSKSEFDEMVRDLHVEAPPTATAERDPTADLDPEDLVLKDDKPKTPKPKRPRNRRHGRSR